MMPFLWWGCFTAWSGQIREDLLVAIKTPLKGIHSLKVSTFPILCFRLKGEILPIRESLYYWSSHTSRVSTFTEVPTYLLSTSMSFQLQLIISLQCLHIVGLITVFADLVFSDPSIPVLLPGMSVLTVVSWLCVTIPKASSRSQEAFWTNRGQFLPGMFLSIVVLSTANHQWDR